MSLLELLRSTARSRLPSGQPDPDRLEPGQRLLARVPRRWRVVAWGALAAGLSWLAVLALVFVSWLLSPAVEAGAGQLLGLSAGLWLLGAGVPAAVPTPAGPVPVGVAPLLVWGLSLWLALALLTRARLADPSLSAPALARRFGGGYAGAVAGLALLALAGPMQPAWERLAVPLLVPALALAQDLLADPPPALVPRLPAWLTRAWRPAAYGLLTLGGAGLVLVVGALVARWETVTGLYAAAGATGVAAVLLTAAQLPFLPNMVMWAVAFLAGPGFQVGAGSVVSVSGSAPGLLPLVPVFGALPPDGPFPGWVRLGLLLPVVAGAVVGRSAQRRWVRLAPWTGPARTAATAVVLDTAAVLLLALLGTGPAGVQRLTHIGPAPWLLAGAVLVELAVGAALWQAGVRLLARVRPQRPTTGR